MSSVDVHVFSKQAQALDYLSPDDSEVSEVLYGGGARGGKTYLGCLWQILRRITMAGSVGFICREESVKLRDTTVVTFFEVLTDLHLNSVVEFNSTRLIANFSNGSVIYFRDLKLMPSDPEYDRLGSYGITDCFIDEAQQICAKAIYTDFVKPAKMGTLAPHRRFIKSLPLDNPHVDQAYIDNLLKADKVTVQRLYFGNFEYDDDPATLCDFDAINDLFTNEHVLPKPARSCSADIALKGHDRFIVTVWEGNVCRIVVDEVYSPGKQVYETLRDVLKQEKVPRSYTIVDADGVGSYLESFLPGIKEFHGGGSPNNREKYENLRAECYFKLAELINERKIRVICNPDQRERLMEELGALKQAYIDNDVRRKGIIPKETMKIIIGRSPDYMDALMMNMFFRRTKPTNGAKMNVKSYSTE